MNPKLSMRVIVKNHALRTFPYFVDDTSGYRVSSTLLWRGAWPCEICQAPPFFQSTRRVAAISPSDLGLFELSMTRNLHRHCLNGDECCADSRTQKNRASKGCPEKNAWSIQNVRLFAYWRRRLRTATAPVDSSKIIDAGSGVGIWRIL